MTAVVQAEAVAQVQGWVLAAALAEAGVAWLVAEHTLNPVDLVRHIQAEAGLAVGEHHPHWVLVCLGDTGRAAEHLDPPDPKDNSKRIQVVVAVGMNLGRIHVAELVMVAGAELREDEAEESWGMFLLDQEDMLELEQDTRCSLVVDKR
jgi:hypothetical protein